MLKTLKLAKKFSAIFIIFMLKTTLKTLVSSLFDKISRHIERVFNMLKIKMDKNTNVEINRRQKEETENSVIKFNYELHDATSDTESSGSEDKVGRVSTTSF